MKRYGVLLAVVILCGCVHIRTAKVTPSKAEAAFCANPCCETTYALVGEKKQAAVPLILDVLDRCPGETNAPTRCLVIQGALWRAEICSNTAFAVIIQRGNNDPSAAVRAKTTRMLERSRRH